MAYFSLYENVKLCHLSFTEKQKVVGKAIRLFHQENPTNKSRRLLQIFTLVFVPAAYIYWSADVSFALGWVGLSALLFAVYLDYKESDLIEPYLNKVLED